MSDSRILLQFCWATKFEQNFVPFRILWGAGFVNFVAAFIFLWTEIPYVLCAKFFSLRFNFVAILFVLFNFVAVAFTFLGVFVLRKYSKFCWILLFWPLLLLVVLHVNEVKILFNFVQFCCFGLPILARGLACILSWTHQIGLLAQGAEPVVPTEAPHHGPEAARKRTRGGTGGSNRVPASRTTAPPG